MFRNAKFDDNLYIKEHLHTVTCGSKYIFRMKTSINLAFDCGIIAKLFALCCLGCIFPLYCIIPSIIALHHTAHIYDHIKNIPCFCLKTLKCST